MSSPKKIPLVSIVTINYNQLTHTVELLNSLKNVDYPNIEVIVVDNNSKKDPTQTLHSKSPSTLLVKSEVNLGFAGGNNLGLKKAKGDYILLLNNDTEVKPDAISILVKFFETKTKAGICCPLILFHNSGETIQYAGSTSINALTGRNSRIGFKEKDRGQFKQPYETSFAHGAAMMIKKSVIDQVGPMPELYFLYYEELDWCEKIKNNGYEIYVVPESKIYHKESMSTGKDSTLKTYYLTRNRLLFMRRNTRGIPKLIFILFFVLIAIPKQFLKFVLRGKFSHAKELIKALLWNITHHKSGLRLLAASVF